MEVRRMKLQQQLVDLGYNYALNEESVLLVEKLIADLLETTDSLQRYMTISQNALQELDSFKFGAEPYKCDNAKLTEQVNDLHIQLITQTETHAKTQRDLKRKITQLEKENEEFIESNKKQRKRIRELELNAVRKSVRHSSVPPSGSCKAQSTSTDKQQGDINSVMVLSDQKLKNLTRENSKLRDHQVELCKTNEELAEKLKHREREILRLNRMMEGGKPLETLKQDCCYKDVQAKLVAKKDEVVCLQKTCSDLESKLKESRCKQHEAMQNAVHLGERNEQLEKELKEIDQMALVVEQECNNSLKQNEVKIKKVQERLHGSMTEIQVLEKELHTLKIEREKFRADLDAANIENRHLQSTLDTALEDKNLLAQQLKNYAIIENDLNAEIDRLVQQTANQTRTIADLNGQLKAQRAAAAAAYDSGNEGPRKSPFKQVLMAQAAIAKENKKLAPKKPSSPKSKRSLKQNKQELGGNREYQQQHHVDTNRHDEYVNQLTSERDFYIREYKELLEKQRQAPMIGVTNETTVMQQTRGATDCCAGVRNEIDDLKNRMLRLQREKDDLATEKHSLLSRLEAIHDYNDSSDYLLMKAASKRIERERDLFKTDAARLMEEGNALRQRMKEMTDMHKIEVDRLEATISSNENELRKVEAERYEMMQSQGSKRATMAIMEDQCCALKEQLRSTDADLSHHKLMYSQLKVLHEQTDRALADSQQHLHHLEKQLSSYEQKHDALDNRAISLNSEIARQQQDIEVLKRNIIEVEREKDALLRQLDEKTERVANFENELESRARDIEAARSQSSELQQKITATIDERNVKECELKCKSNDVLQLKRELEAAVNSKEHLVRENKRIQDKLSMSSNENRRAVVEIEASKRQIADLSAQVQKYCTEVKRFEDMMSDKEHERTAMLEQFKNLSDEANVLESSKTCLEHEAIQSKMQLRVAFEHAGELENIVENQKTLIGSYEEQIATLSNRISNMEMHAKNGGMHTENMHLELKSLREVCAMLQKQKDDLNKVVSDKNKNERMMKMELAHVKQQETLASTTLQKQQHSGRLIESHLAETREALAEQRLINSDLQNEIINMKTHMADMDRQMQILLSQAQAREAAACSGSASSSPESSTSSERPCYRPAIHIQQVPDMISSSTRSASISPSTDDININAYKQELTNYNQNAGAGRAKFSITKMKVTTFSQTNKKDT